jgi:hypothetical protein
MIELRVCETGGVLVRVVGEVCGLWVVTCGWVCAAGEGSAQDTRAGFKS